MSEAPKCSRESLTLMTFHEWTRTMREGSRKGLVRLCNAACGLFSSIEAVIICSIPPSIRVVPLCCFLLCFCIAESCRFRRSDRRQLRVALALLPHSASPFQMRFLALIVLLVLTTLSVADCGCGAKCSTYSDASKCTRCCTATVKRSLPTVPRRSHRFLLPQLTNPIRIPMWLAASSYAQSQPTLPKRHNRRYSRPTRHLLHEILAEALDRRDMQ